MIRLALYQPDIPQNMGTIMRLGACLAIPIDVIGPTGFDLSDRALKRAGMDYLQNVDLTKYVSFEKYIKSHEQSAGRLILCSTKSDKNYTDFNFKQGDTLMLGRETSGVPSEVHDIADNAVKIPMANNMRSLNIAVSAAMISGEALRQLKGFA